MKRITILISIVAIIEAVALALIILGSSGTESSDGLPAPDVPSAVTHFKEENQEIARGQEKAKVESTRLREEIMDLRSEIQRLRAVESEYAERKSRMAQTERYLQDERNEAERVRQIALDAARRLEAGDTAVLTDAEVAKALAEPQTFLFNDDNFMQIKGPQGIVQFQGDDVIMLPDEGRVLIGRSEEIAGDLKSVASEQDATLHFRNNSQQNRLIFWIDFDGKPKLGRSLRPGEAFSTKSYMGHQWVITDSDGEGIAALEPVYVGEDEDIILE